MKIRFLALAVLCSSLYSSELLELVDKNKVKELVNNTGLKTLCVVPSTYYMLEQLKSAIFNNPSISPFLQHHLPTDETARNIVLGTPLLASNILSTLLVQSYPKVTAGLIAPLLLYSAYKGNKLTQVSHALFAIDLYCSAHL